VSNSMLLQLTLSLPIISAHPCRGRDASRGGGGEKHSRERFERPRFGSEGQAQQTEECARRGSSVRGLDAFRADSGPMDSHRQSFDTSADCLSDLVQFDMDDW